MILVMQIEKNQKECTLTSADPLFDDIRPCTDAEVQSELNKIAKDDIVVDNILKFRYPLLFKHLAFIVKPIIKAVLKNKVSKFKTVEQFQRQVAKYMDHLIATTTDGLELVGFDKLDPKEGYLFISNHRDIALDPAFIDIALYRRNLDTVRIAIGDNLLRLPAATSLMRLNKSFIVKRSVVSPRDKLKALNHLSAYIGLSIQEGHSVWIAEREGRAKDGDDKAESAVMKMLGLYGRQLKKPFSDYMKSLKIVPVAITYEFDPNDLAKARELDIREKNNGAYTKDKYEDIETIIRGIRDYKGRVKLVCGEPIVSGFDTAEELCELIDNFIYNNYEMYPSALLSAGITDNISSEDKKKFEQRLQSYPEHLRERVCAMYAKPYFNKVNRLK